jgi:hypothetical protein
MDNGTKRATVTATVLYELTADGRLEAAKRGLYAAAKQRIEGAEVPADLLEYVRVDETGGASLDLRNDWPYAAGSLWNACVRRSAKKFDRPMEAGELFDELRKAGATARAEVDEELRKDAEARAEREADLERTMRILEGRLDEGRDNVWVKNLRVDTYLQCDPPGLLDALGIKTRHLLDCGPLQGRADALLARLAKVGEVRAERAEEARKAAAAKEAAEREAAAAERKAAIDAWLEAKGTENQKARRAAGMFPEEEAVMAMEDEAFAAVPTGFVRFEKITVDDCRAAAPLLAERFDGDVVGPQVCVLVKDAETATAAQWTALEKLRAALPGAEIRLRVHRAGLTDDLRSDDVFRWSALVKVKAGPFVHVRAYAMPDGNR